MRAAWAVNAVRAVLAAWAVSAVRALRALRALRAVRARTDDGIDEDRRAPIESIVNERSAEADACDEEDDGVEEVGSHLVESVQKMLDLRKRRWRCGRKGWRWKWCVCR